MMNDILFIHRGRNTKSDYLGALVTNRDVLFDYRGASTLRMLFSACRASFGLPPARVYLVEGGLCFWPAFFKKLRSPRTRIVMMAIEPVFNWRGRSRFKHMFLRCAFRSLDYVLPVSALVQEDARRYTSAPSSVVHHYIEGDVARYRASVPQWTKNILFVIRRPEETGHTKGLDIVYAIFAELRKRDPDWHLYLIGYGTESLVFEDDHVHGEGDQDPLDYFQTCPFLLAPARYDAFLLAVAEGCLAGVVPFVSPTTGAREFVKPVFPKGVIDHQDPAQFATAIIDTFAAEPGPLNAVRSALRAAAATYSRERSAAEMREAVADMRRRWELDTRYNDITL